MDKILGYLAMAYIFLPWRPIVVLVAAVLFVNINGTELYGWQAGLAHGLFFLPNLVRHLFDGDVLFKATNCTTGYHVAWWIVTCRFVHRLARRCNLLFYEGIGICR
mgnify:CR=1 FL=1